MDMAFSVIDETVNKSAIENFRMFLSKYSYVTKWYVCSDYCFEDAKKKRDVASFVIYPHDVDFDLKQNYIQSLQNSDLKKTRTINPDFCRFLHSGAFFCFSFLLEKDNLFARWRDKDSQQRLVDTCIEMMERWITTTPQSATLYTEYAARMRKFRNGMDRKSFNRRLFARVLAVTFLAGYVKYLLLQEHRNVQLYSWLSDRDAVLEWEGGIGEIFYHITSHGLCANRLSNPAAEDRMEEVYYISRENAQFYDQLNRVADYICGTLADFDYENGSVTAKKQCVLIEEAIADNDFIVNIGITGSGAKRIVYKKTGV